MGLARAAGCGTNHGAEARAGLRGACRRASPRDAFASSSRRYNFGLVRGWPRWRKSVAPVRASSDEDDWDEIDKLMRELEEEERRRGGDADASSSFAQASDHADPAVQDPTPAVRLSHQTDQLPATKKKRKPPAQALIVHASSSLFAFFPPRPDEQGKDELQRLTVSELKERLRTLGLPVSGRKAVLVDRLLSASSASTTAASVDRPISGDIFSSWDEVQGAAGSGSFDEDGGNFDGGNFGPPADPLFADAALEIKPADASLRAVSSHFDKDFVAAVSADGGEVYRSRVPANPEAMLRGYESLPEGYTWRATDALDQDLQSHAEKFPSHEVFSLSGDADFLVRCRGGEEKGRLWLDLTDVYVFHKPTGVYCRPQCEGDFSVLEETEFSEYYAYPIASWFPGDALKGRDPAQEIIKIVLVQVKSSDLLEGSEEGEEEEAAHGEGFELDISRSFVLDGQDVKLQGMRSPRDQLMIDYESRRSGKSGSLTTQRWNAFSFPKPFVLSFNGGGDAAEDGGQAFGLCVSEHAGLSLQRWESMRDPTEVVEERMRVEEAGRQKQQFIEEGSPFEFLGKVSGRDVDEEWKRLGLDRESA